MVRDDQEFTTPSAIDLASEHSWLNTKEIPSATTGPDSGSENRG